MAYFSDIETFHDCVSDLFDRLSKDPDIKERALESKLIVNFVFRNPEGEVWIDCTGDDMVVIPGKQDLTPDATLIMDTDVAHRFWLGKLNLIKSLTSGEIESEGSVPRLLKLFPVIKPAFKIYPEVLPEKGLEMSLPNLGPFRPSWRSPVIDNLYLAGASTNPGVGVPLVMISGINASACIVRDKRW